MRELKAIMPYLKQVDYDLDEIQSLDSKEIVAHKLASASSHTNEPLCVEDTSLVFHCLGSLPGPFIKWFEKDLGLAALADLVSRYPDHTATARTTMGYRSPNGEVRYFDGTVRGTIVSPRGRGFGWDAIFMPTGHELTFGELGIAVKNTMSMRAQAARKLDAYLRSV
jgi:inosine triphosphate pyrophosphatase